MTPQQIKLVQVSWQQASPLNSFAVGSLFYARLFEANPELRALFKSPVPEQSKKLVHLVIYVMAKLDSLHEVTNDLQKLAQRYVLYGLKEKHYDRVGEALRWTLRKALAYDWNRELEKAWLTCYTVLASAMIDVFQKLVSA